MPRILSVRLHGIPLAILEQNDHGKMQLSYLPAAHRALSISLPVREAPYEHHDCDAYFGGLLPESDSARKAIAQRFRANPNNNFSLLQAIGYDCAGAVSLHAPEEPVIPAESLPLDGKPISEAELAEHILELPLKPLFLGVEGIRLSLAGAQDKAAVCLIEGQIALPVNGTPTTHILKPAVAHFENMVLNEYLGLTLAQAVGLRVPRAEIRTAEGIPYLLIERYDRIIHDGDRISRIHQEDFCQALGVLSTLKYQADGGPNAARCFALMQQTSRPAVSIKQLLEHLVFNILIGNCDAHAKNYSLLHFDDGRIEVAPVYDVICTRIYEDINDRMAMKIGGKYRAEDLFGRHWRRFATEVGITYPLLRSVLSSINKKLQGAIEKQCGEEESPKALAILEFIGNHAAGVTERFKRGDD